ncbi:unnamed protein product [Symbiodinium sp. KB8]|nr:unnamed protein product [Symbiodinium sp. KB8]
MPSDSPSELDKFCKDHGVHEILYQALALKGLESVDDFAYAFPEIRSLEALLSGLSETDLADMGATDQYHGVQELLAADRKIWGTIGTLVSAGWSLDEALYEDWPSNWVYKAHGKVLCKRFQRNLCTDIASQDPQPTPALGPPLVAGQEEEGSPGRASPPQVLLPDTSGPLGARCKALADPEAIPFLELRRAPPEQESRLMMQCLWSRSIIAIIASLPVVALLEELAISLLQAIKASAAIAILTVPRDHGFLRCPELAACLHDASFHMCPSPRQGEIILASTKLPTWPCPDSELLALEALGRISQLPLRLGHITEVSYASLLKTSGPFIAHRPPICDGAGAPSSADHSLPHASGISKASKAWIQWAQKSDLSHRVFAHISQSRPEHPLSQEEQSEALAILCSALNLDQASMATVSPGQPFRLQLMQALAELTDDPDQDLPSVLAEGVHTGVFSEIKPSDLWPPAKLRPLSQSGLEVCQGNWRPAEEDPETVAALLAEEEAAGWIQQVPGGLKAAKKRWPKGIAVGKLSLVKAEGRDSRLVLDSTICQVNPLCRIPEAVTMPTVQEVRRSSYQLEEGLSGR